MHAGSLDIARGKRKSCSRRQPRATLASRVLSKLPKCIHNSIDAQLIMNQFFYNIATSKRKNIVRKTERKKGAKNVAVRRSSPWQS